MKVTSFKKYLVEQVLSEATHLVHAEEYAFKITGADDMFDILRSAASDMATGKQSGVGITTKFDGAPAVTFGLHPLNNKFFVSTKGFFAKDSKAAFTDADVDRLFESEGLREKLKIALKYMRELKPKGIYQGDMMYTVNDLQKKNVDGFESFVFRPNTITYAVPVDSETGRKISQSQIGIVIHTKYDSKIPIDQMIQHQSFDVKVNRDFAPSSNVWAIDAGSTFANKKILNPSDYATVTQKLDKAQSIIEKNKEAAYDLPEDMKMRFETYVNTLVRSGTSHSPKEFVDRFNVYMDSYFQSETAKFKTDKKKAEMQGKLKQYQDILLKNKRVINDLATAYVLIYDAKMIMVKALASSQGDIKTYVDNGGTLQPTAPEGFVASSPKGVVKLVDRSEFSRLNFTLAKNWTK